MLPSCIYVSLALMSATLFTEVTDLAVYFFEPAAAMRNSMVVYDRANSSFFTLKHGDIDWQPIFQNAMLFHCSGITCAMSKDALDTTFDALETAKSMGVEITCDINYRANLWHYEGANAAKTIHKLMEYSSFIFGDQNEWEVGSGLKHIPFEAQDADYEIDEAAYLEHFHQLSASFRNCKRMTDCTEKPTCFDASHPHRCALFGRKTLQNTPL